MNGIEKAALQRVLGTRTVIEDIDLLRILCGCSNVQMLTPIVETKLRAGSIPLKSLHVRLNISYVISDVIKQTNISTSGDNSNYDSRDDYDSGYNDRGGDDKRWLW